MLNNKRGFSLTVLVIAIAVIVIVTSTALISIKTVTKDRVISEFMRDLADVKQYAIEYYNKTGTLPIKEEGNVETSLLTVLSSDNALNQIDETDTGEYYFVDITKLGKIHITDENRGYIINEGTLNVYVTTPVEYEGIKYYTLTPDILGKTKAVDELAPFEVTIMGNPVTWAEKAEILVYVPNEKINDEGTGWNFRWLPGSHSLDDFKTAKEVNYFTYGETITLTKNGIYTINVENPNGKAIVRKVVITKIDDIPPTITMQNGKLVVDDAETGVKNLYYKIKETRNFKISDAARKENPGYYTSENEDANDTDEQKLNKYLGAKKNKGERIENYLADYNEYYTQYMNYDKIISDEESTSDEIDNAQASIRVLNNSYPQFAYGNRPFPNSERNIVIYVEDMAGNGAVYSALSRGGITTLQYALNENETTFDGKMVINNNNTYTNSRDVSLYMDAMHAKYYFATEDEIPSGEFKLFNNNRENFRLSKGDGKKIVYVIFENEAKKRIKVSDDIILDETPPSTDAPTVSGTASTLSIRVNQTDTKIVDGVETQSGLTGNFKYGIKEEAAQDYKWYKKVAEIPTLEIGKTYHVVTEATDKAGNSQPSEKTIVKFNSQGNSGNNDETEKEVTITYKDLDDLSSIAVENKVTVNIYSNSACTNLLKTLAGNAVYGTTLPVGTYYIKIMGAPDGYVAISDTLERSVTEENNTWTFSFKKGLELPSAGSNWTIEYNYSNIIKIEMDNISDSETVTFGLYKIVDITNNEYRMRLPFSNSVSLDQLSESSAILKIASIIQNENCQPIAEKVASKNNNAIFKNMENGIYFLMPTSCPTTLMIIPTFVIIGPRMLANHVYNYTGADITCRSVQCENGSIEVAAQLFCDGISIFAEEYEVQVGLFVDENATILAPGNAIETIRINQGSSGNIVFEDLQHGTYYVYVLDENENPIVTDEYTIPNSNGIHMRINYSSTGFSNKLEVSDNQLNHQVNIELDFDEQPDF